MWPPRTGKAEVGGRDPRADGERDTGARGRLRKARDGKVIVGRQADYGFRYNEGRDDYVVYEPEMATVRRIFEMFGAEGASVYAVKAELDAANVPPPRGVYWTRTLIRACVFDDVYEPHTFEEVAALGSV